MPRTAPTPRPPSDAPSGSGSARRARLRRVEPLARIAAVGAAVLLYYLMAVGGVMRESATFDEVAHVTAGYSYWAFDDFRLQPENGNWPQRLVAIPLVLGAARFPTLDQRAWRESDVWELGDRFFYDSGNDADALLLRSRMMVALVGAALAVLVFVWSRRLFGEAGGWVSLVVCVFSPTMLAHGALATSDMMAAAAFTAAAWALWAVVHRVTPWTVAASTLATAAVFLSKFSAPIVVIVALGTVLVRLSSTQPVMVEWRGRRVELRTRRAQISLFVALAAAHALAAFVLIWASYGFRYEAVGPHGAGGDHLLVAWSELLSNESAASRFVAWARDHHLLPEAYLYGLADTLFFARHRAAFFNGEFSAVGGWRWFFPYVALVKTTPPALLLLIAAAATLVWRWVRRGDAAGATARERAWRGLYALAPLWLLVGIYWAFAITTNLNIGHRHLLPAIPATIVLAGGAASALARPLSRRGALLGALLAWHAVESIRIAPHHLAYFNPLDGGPRRAYRHVVDSSLDWGQDLPGLKRWLDDHGVQGTNHPPVYLSYFGSARPSYYGIDARSLPSFLDRSPARVPEPLVGGIYCISATMLQGVYLSFPGSWTAEYERQYQATLDNLRIFAGTSTDPTARAALLRQTGEDFWWKAFRAFEELRFARLAAYLRHRDPDDEVGYSILIYRLGDDDLARALGGPPPAR